MAVMLGNLYGALRDAGVPDDRAQRAAEEVAGYQDDVQVVRDEVSRVREEIAGVKATLSFHTWMIGIVMALVLAVLALVLRLGVH